MRKPRKMQRRVVRRVDAAPEKGSTTDNDVDRITYQHADGTVDAEDGPDVVGGVMYMKDINLAPIHFTRDRSKAAS